MLDTAVAAALPKAKRDPDVVIELPGFVKGKGRPRSRIATGRGGQQFVAVYTDSETRSYEAMLRFAGEQAMRQNDNRTRLPFECALRVRVTAVFVVPKSRSRRDTEQSLAGIIRPTGKPDCDNILKCVGDSLNGVVWRDDSIIVDLMIRKFYGIHPMLLIEVWRFLGTML
jgi:Holliday junction resolvase RusA-like endonuclease